MFKVGDIVYKAICSCNDEWVMPGAMGIVVIGSVLTIDWEKGYSKENAAFCEPFHNTWSEFDGAVIKIGEI